MRQRLQHWLVGGVVFAALGLALCFGPTDLGARPAERKPFTPTVEKLPHKAYKQDIADSKVSFEMVPIPGGTFLMGSPDDEKGRNADEGPQHPVTIKPFWMGKYEVTWDEYDLYWKNEAGPRDEKKDKDKGKDDKKDSDAITRPTPPYADETFEHGREGHPVLCITHHAAMEYCRWLSKNTGKAYRLPTEAEWEWAARAGTTTAYSFGDDPSKLGEYAAFADNCEDHPMKVGQKKPNPWGLYDMYGNVSEWCLDQYKKDYYAGFPLDKPILQPVNLPGPDRFPHVARGGSWTDGPDRCRSSARRSSDKSWLKHDPQQPKSIWWLTKMDVIGFRVVRAVEEQENLRGLRSKVTRESK